MSFHDSKTVSNDPALVHALAGEKIVGTLFDADGAMWLIVESGYALVVKASPIIVEGEKPSLAYYRVHPADVSKAISKRLTRITALREEEMRLINIAALEKHLGAEPVL